MSEQDKPRDFSNPAKGWFNGRPPLPPDVLRMIDDINNCPPETIGWELSKVKRLAEFITTGK